jgi:diguanylate cyclase (GGDEF)-like protein/PAS domain S-box-containing protein
MTLSVREQLRSKGDCLLIIDVIGQVTYASPQALAVLGLRASTVVGRPLLEVAVALASEELSALARDLLRGLVGARTFTTRTSAGWDVDVVAMPADEGVALFVAASEFTADRRAEHPSLAMLDKVLGSIRDAVLVTTAEPVERPGPVIVYANEALAHHTGYSIDELLGRSPRILQGPGTDLAELHRLRVALDAWQSVTVEVINYRKDGSAFWVEMDITPLADANGWYTHWVSVQRDVTARREQSQQRTDQQQIVQTILDSLPSQTAMLDELGGIVAVNKPWRDYWTAGSTMPEPDWSQVNYLDACDNALLPSVIDLAAPIPDPRRAAEGIRSVLERRAADFDMDYVCVVGTVVYWFHMHVLSIAGGPGAVVTHTDITARKKGELQLAHQATHDDLTGLPNRQLTLKRLDDTLARARDDGSLVAVIFVGLDNFKDVNYAYGHAVGDELLQIVASRLSALPVAPELVGRFGGDEFVVVLAGLAQGWDPDNSLSALRDALGAPIGIGQATIRPSMSFGVVTSPPHEGTAAAMLRDADTASHASKSSGRDRWTVFSDEIRRGALVRATSEKRIIEALADDDFVLHFQPVVDVGSGQTVGSEALLRLREPDGQLLAPQDFLPIVESGPLAEDVGLWVLDRALQVQAGWLPTNPDHRMSVNVSPRQFGHGRLPEQVAAALTRHGVPAGRLVLEITEDLLLDVSSTVAAELAELSRMGVLIAMDDFGTGYSSLAYLQHHPFNIVKIDRSFLQRCDRNSIDLLSAMVALARAVDATTVIEGVETAEQLAVVRRTGAALAQGFLLGRPVEPTRIPVNAPAHLFGAAEVTRR